MNVALPTFCSTFNWLDVIVKGNELSNLKPVPGFVIDCPIDIELNNPLRTTVIIKVLKKFILKPNLVP
jgi:ABC-type antimicrobial peptide transport system permease subunit